MPDILIYDTIDSTNLEAQRLLASRDIPHGTILLAKDQTAGRGQLGRRWWTEAGDHLAMTLILRPQGYDSSRIPELGMMINLSIVRVLRNLSPEFSPLIKWPNDIYLHGSKLCGILIENTLAGHRLQHVIAGIGMNVNERVFREEIPNGISLAMASGKTFDIESIALQIRQSVLAIFLEKMADWKPEYDQYIFGKNTVHSFGIEGEVIQAEVTGVDDRARLLLHIDKQTRAYSTHQIKWIL